MSLSKEVIKGNYQGVQTLLGAGAPVNIIDEYGYTPLIHAAGSNRLDIAKLILQHQARVDIIDVTGSTALQWAIDNDNLEMCELFLGFGANANWHNASGQPILFYPLLRKNNALTKLLVSKGADLNFGKDFIMAKLIGHRFELKGHSDIVNPQGLFISVDLEGFYLEFTLSLIRTSLEKYIRSYAAHRMDIHERELKVIIKALSNAHELRKYKHFSKDKEQNRDKIIPLLKKDPLLLPVSYMSHAINFIHHGEFLAKCDRGVNKMTDPIGIYRVGNPDLLTPSYLMELMFKAHTHRSIKTLVPKELGLIPYASLPIEHQKTGNCSWANTEAAVPTLLYMLLHDRLKDKRKADKLVKEIMKFYRQWLEWDKDRALEECLEGFDKLSFNRQKSRAALLGNVLFQACNPSKPADVARARKILKLLVKPEFHYITRIYTNVFVRGSRSSHGRSFKRLIELCGYQLSQFSD